MKIIRSLLHNLAFLFIPATGLAATLTTVPMQGTMVMPQLAYHADDGSLTVTLDPTIPQLKPLLVSNPADAFDPADPWYDHLDPSRQGLAFSRRYGFTMDTLTDPLPTGTAIWIRKISSSPGLGIYRYRSGASRLWEPIFGTAGVTNALQWDGTMFHPAVTAPPGTNAYTATFEAFLVNLDDGSLGPGANTGPFTLNWTDVPDGRPTLSIGPNLTITWPLSATNYVLEAADTLPASSWTLVTNAPVLLEGQLTVVLEPSASARFFRMRLAP